MIDASELLGSRQVAGVQVNPVGFFQATERKQAGYGGGGIVVPGAVTAAVGNTLGGAQGAERRAQDTELSHRTPTFGTFGFLAVTETELAVTTTDAPKQVGRRLGQLVVRVPRSTVLSAELDGGWRRPTLYIFSSAPLRITFTDGTAWAFEVSRFYRRYATAVVRSLSP